MLADDLCEWGRAIIAASPDGEETADSLEQYLVRLSMGWHQQQENGEQVTASRKTLMVKQLFEDC